MPTLNQRTTPLPEKQIPDTRPSLEPADQDKRGRFWSKYLESVKAKNKAHAIQSWSAGAIYSIRYSESILSHSTSTTAAARV